MSDFLVEEMQNNKGAKIKIIGCGGGGGNMINHMINSGLNELDIIAANTDAQDLIKSKAKTKIQIGEKKTRGLGAGADPEVGKESAQESFEEIKASLNQSDIVFIASGFGGGTGTGATPIVAQAAKEVGALSVSIITLPFNFEGKKRRRQAEAGLAELKKESDSIIVIQNEKLLGLIDKKAGQREAFQMVDEILVRAVKGMVAILLNNGHINVDFADVRSVMKHKGLALMGTGSAKGENAVMNALKNAIECPLLDGFGINGAKGIIIHFKGSSETCSMHDIGQACEEVQELADPDVNFIYGTTYDDAMNDEVEITIIATGFDIKDEQNIAPSAQKSNFSSIQKVSGGYNNEIINELDDKPAYLRKQIN